jgi:hypothetical protein
MPFELHLKKPDLVGLATSGVLSFAVIVLTPVASWAVLWQVLIVAVPLLLNFWVWRKESIPAMSIGRAAVQAAIGLALVSVIAAIDTGFGFAFGAKSAIDAFLNSGPAGAPVDMFLAAILLFIGVPTIARSVFEFYALR